MAVTSDIPLLVRGLEAAAAVAVQPPDTAQELKATIRGRKSDAGAATTRDAEAQRERSWTPELSLAHRAFWQDLLAPVQREWATGVRNKLIDQLRDLLSEINRSAPTLFSPLVPRPDEGADVAEWVARTVTVYTNAVLRPVLAREHRERALFLLPVFPEEVARQLFIYLDGGGRDAALRAWLIAYAPSPRYIQEAMATKYKDNANRVYRTHYDTLFSHIRAPYVHGSFAEGWKRAYIAALDERLAAYAPSYPFPEAHWHHILDLLHAGRGDASREFLSPAAGGDEYAVFHDEADLERSLDEWSGTDPARLLTADRVHRTVLGRPPRPLVVSPSYVVHPASQLVRRYEARAGGPEFPEGGEDDADEVEEEELASLENRLKKIEIAAVLEHGQPGRTISVDANSSSPVMLSVHVDASVLEKSPRTDLVGLTDTYTFTWFHNDRPMVSKAVSGQMEAQLFLAPPFSAETHSGTYHCSVERQLTDDGGVAVLVQKGASAIATVHVTARCVRCSERFHKVPLDRQMEAPLDCAWTVDIEDVRREGGVLTHRTQTDYAYLMELPYKVLGNGYWAGLEKLQTWIEGAEGYPEHRTKPADIALVRDLGDALEALAVVASPLLGKPPAEVKAMWYGLPPDDLRAALAELHLAPPAKMDDVLPVATLADGTGYWSGLDKLQDWIDTTPIYPAHRSREEDSILVRQLVEHLWDLVRAAAPRLETTPDALVHTWRTRTLAQLRNERYRLSHIPAQLFNRLTVASLPTEVTDAEHKAMEKEWRWALGDWRGHHHATRRLPDRAILTLPRSMALGMRLTPNDLRHIAISPGSERPAWGPIFAGLRQALLRDIERYRQREAENRPADLQSLLIHIYFYNRAVQTITDGKVPPMSWAAFRDRVLEPIWMADVSQAGVALLQNTYRYYHVLHV